MADRTNTQDHANGPGRVLIPWQAIRPGLVVRYHRAQKGRGAALGQVAVITTVVNDSDGKPDVILGDILPTVGGAKRGRRLRGLTCRAISLRTNYEAASDGFEYATLGLDINALAPIAQELGVEIAYSPAFVYPIMPGPVFGEAIRAWAMPPKIQQTEPAPAEPMTKDTAIMQLANAVKVLSERQTDIERALVKLADQLNTLESAAKGSRTAQVEIDPTALGQSLALSLLELGDSFVEPLADRLGVQLGDAVVGGVVKHFNRVLFTENFVKLLAQHLAAQQTVTGQQRIQLFGSEGHKGSKHG
jgi:hypothetical protein